MKLNQLIENVLSEEILDEAAKTIQQSDQEKLALLYHKDGLGKQFVLYRPEVFAWSFKSGTQLLTDSIVGFINITYNQNCDVWFVQYSAALKGYGPLMYDIAMSAIAPDYLGADRNSVSLQARRVWAYMLTVRAHDFNTKKLQGNKCLAGYQEEELKRVFSIKNPIDFSSLVARHESLMKKMKNTNATRTLLNSGDHFFTVMSGET